MNDSSSTVMLFLNSQYTPVQHTATTVLGPVQETALSEITKALQIPLQEHFVTQSADDAQAREAPTPSLCVLHLSYM